MELLNLTTKESMDADKLYLNFGAGNPVDFWLNFDSSPNYLLPSWFHELLVKYKLSSRSKEFINKDYVYFKFSDTKKLPFVNNSLQAVFASHVLEHLSTSEVEHFIAECHRVLETGGILRVIVPNLEAKIDFKSATFSLENELLTLPAELKQNKIRAMLEAFHGFPSFHKTLFVSKNIEKYFGNKWHVSIKKEYLDSEIPKKILSIVEQKSRTKEALIFELRKQ